MFGYNVKKFFTNWVVILLVLVISAAAAFGFNSITKSFDFLAGFDTLSSLFGGMPSLLAVLVVLILLAGVGYLLFYMTKTNYDEKRGLQGFHIFVVLAFVVVAAIVGFRWINIGDDFGSTLGIIIGLIVLVTVATLVVTDRTKSVSSTTTAP